MVLIVVAAVVPFLIWGVSTQLNSTRLPIEWAFLEELVNEKRCLDWIAYEIVRAIASQCKVEAVKAALLASWSVQVIYTASGVWKLKVIFLSEYKCLKSVAKQHEQQEEKKERDEGEVQELTWSAKRSRLR